jgi:hypothetical protein
MGRSESDTAHAFIVAWILRGDVPVMSATALPAYPGSHIEHVQTLGAGESWYSLTSFLRTGWVTVSRSIWAVPPPC